MKKQTPWTGKRTPPSPGLIHISEAVVMNKNLATNKAASMAEEDMHKRFKDHLAWTFAWAAEQDIPKQFDELLTSARIHATEAGGNIRKGLASDHSLLMQTTGNSCFLQHTYKLLLDKRQKEASSQGEDDNHILKEGDCEVILERLKICIDKTKV